MVKTFKQYFTKAGALDESYKPVIAPTAKELGMKMQGAFAYHPSVVEEEEDELKPVIKLKKLKRECD
jgi:hypothetical protein